MNGKHDLMIVKHAAFEVELKWLDENDAAVDLTGYTAKMQIRPDMESDTVRLELSSANGRITLGGAAGTIGLYVSPTDTGKIAWDDGVYDIMLTPPDGDTVKLLEGVIAVEPSVTR